MTICLQFVSPYSLAFSFSVVLLLTLDSPGHNHTDAIRQRSIVSVSAWSCKTQLFLFIVWFFDFFSISPRARNRLFKPVDVGARVLVVLFGLISLVQSAWSRVSWARPPAEPLSGTPPFDFRMFSNTVKYWVIAFLQEKKGKNQERLSCRLLFLTVGRRTRHTWHTWHATWYTTWQCTWLATW